MARIRDQYVLDIDTRGAQQAINGVRTALGTLAGVLAVDQVQNFVGGIIDATTQFERYQTQLTTFLGSQEQANAALERLSELSRSLGADVNDLSSAFVIFTRYGLDTSNEALAQFSNIATSNGKSLEQLGEAVGDALTGEYERLKEFGIKVSQENGQIIARIGEDQVAVARTSKDLVRQLQELGSTKFANSIDSSTQLGYSINLLKTSVTEAQRAFGEGLKPALIQVNTELASFLDNNRKIAGELGSGLGESLRTISAGARVLIDNMDLLRTALLTFIGIKFAAGLSSIVVGLGGAVKATGSLAAAFTGAGAALKGLLSRIPLVGRAFATLAAISTPLAAVVAAVSAMTISFEFFKDEVVEVGKTTTTFGEIAQAVFSGIGTIAQRVGNFISEQLGAALKYVSDLFGPFANIVGNAFSAAAGSIQRHVNYMIGAVVGFFLQITVGLKDLPRLFYQSLSSAFTIVGEFVERSGKLFSELWDYIATLGEDEISNTFKGLGEIVSQEGSKIAAQSSINWKEIMGTDYIGTAVNEIILNIEELVLAYREGQVSVEEFGEKLKEAVNPPDVENKTEQTITAVARVTDAVKDYTREIEDRIRAQNESQELARLTGIRRTLKEIELAEKNYARSIRQRIQEQVTAGEITQAEADRQLAEIAVLEQQAIESQQRIAEAAYRESRTFSTGWRQAFEEYVDDANNAARAAESVFKTATQGMEDAIVNFAKTGKFEFKSFLNSVLEDLLRSQVRQLIAQTFSIGSSGPRGGESSGNSFLDLFSGYYATGGMIPAGRFGVVGESGPELVSGPATVSPMGNTNIQYNISAVDAMSFRELLSRDPSFLYAVTEQGRKTIPSTRR